MPFKQKPNKIEVMENASSESGLDNSHEQPNNVRQRETVKSFTENTTLHGARFLFASNIFRRVFWFLSLAACLGYCAIQFRKTVFEFNLKPFNTKITTKDGVRDFPAVTLCNFNMFNKRRYRIAMKEWNRSDEQIDETLDDIARLVQRSSDIASDNAMKKRSPELYERKSNEEAIKMNLEGVAAVFSHKIGEMLLPSSNAFKSCSVNGLPCGPENFTKVDSSSFGQCYTFNSGQNGSQVLKATMASRSSGLKLRLNIEHNSYIGNTYEPSVGLIVLVHDQKSFPYIGEFGVAVQPGIHTFCSIKKKKIINLKHPYSTNCTERKLAIFNNTSYNYSKAACLVQCLNEFVVKKCGCRPIHFKADAPVCASNDTVLCVFPQHELFGSSEEKRECDKNCPQPCNQVEFETTFSYGGLQRDTLAKYLISFVNGTEELSVLRTLYEPLLNMTKSEQREYIDDNILSLDIYFKQLTYDEVEQTPVLEIWNLIGTLGGNFGLFLGMSILTVLEFVDFVFRRLFCFFC